MAQKNIVLGIGGGIAAYKSVELARRLRDGGHDVRVVMTPSACEFVTPLTLQAATGSPVGTTLLDPAAEAAMGHIELARWADLLLIAPATANLLARFAHGAADDLLTTIALATSAQLVVAPAMNQAMWAHPAVRANMATLTARGVRVIGPASGLQACGDDGPGRMVEPLDIVAALDECSHPALANVDVLLTAGPTYEDIDPVRFIANRSSGKMGYALAGAFAAAGARVTLVSGPVRLDAPSGVNRIMVRSAAQMHDEVMRRIDRCQLFVATAAVADFAVRDRSEQKIKKGSSETMSLELVRNPDILADVGARARRPFTVGFAAETERLEEYARRKLERKGADLIVANDVSRADCGFETDENHVLVIAADGVEDLGRQAKVELARRLVALIGHRFAAARAASGDTE